jgi:hypothetical protein
LVEFPFFVSAKPLKYLVDGHVIIIAGYFELCEEVEAFVFGVYTDNFLEDIACHVCIFGFLDHAFSQIVNPKVRFLSKADLIVDDFVDTLLVFDAFLLLSDGLCYWKFIRDQLDSFLQGFVEFCDTVTLFLHLEERHIQIVREYKEGSLVIVAVASHSFGNYKDFFAAEVEFEFF